MEDSQEYGINKKKELSVTISPTDILCTLSKPGGVPARHWVGKTKSGSDIVFFVAGISIPENDSLVKDLAEVLETLPNPIIKFE